MPPEHANHLVPRKKKTFNEANKTKSKSKKQARRKVESGKKLIAVV